MFHAATQERIASGSIQSGHAHTLSFYMLVEHTPTRKWPSTGLRSNAHLDAFILFACVPCVANCLP